MLIPRTNTWQNGFRKRTINTSLKIGPISLKFITIALLAIAALFYLAQTTQSSAFKGEIMNLQEQENKAQTDVQQLEVESSRLKSLSVIQNNAQNLNLEPDK